MVFQTSIFIPVYKNKKTIFDILRKITSQSIQADIHLLFTQNDQLQESDFKKYPVTIHTIPKKEFHHSKTRNLALKYSKSRIIVFLSADAIPKDKYWLENLIAPFKDKTVGGCFSRQVPRKGVLTSEEFFYNYHFPPKSEVRPKKNPRNIFDMYFFSDVSSALRKELLEKYPFTDRIYMSEDQYFSKKILENGYKTTYVANSVVIHSHNFTITQTFKRYFDSATNLSIIYEKNNYAQFISIGSSFTLQTLLYVLKHNPLSLPKEVLYLCAKVLGTFAGKNRKYIPQKYLKSFSLYNS